VSFKKKKIAGEKKFQKLKIAAKKLRSFFVARKFWLIFLGAIATLILIFTAVFWPLRIFFGDLFSLVGFWGEKNYLILLQNENELRPGGGFLTSVAILETSRGRPNLQIFPAETVAPPDPPIPAPEPIERVFSTDEKFRGWVLRDSNFNLDFPTNAARAISFLKKDSRFSGKKFDAVFAVNFAVVEKLTEIYGPVEIFGEKITARNLFSVLQKAAKDFDLHDEQSWKNRKNVFGEIAETLFRKIPRTPTKFPKLVSAVENLLSQKQILLFFRDENLQRKVAAKNWAGDLPAAENIFAVNFANLGGRKVDRFLRQNWRSTFDFAPEESNLNSENSATDSAQKNSNLNSAQNSDLNSAENSNSFAEKSEKNSAENKSEKTKTKLQNETFEIELFHAGTFNLQSDRAAEFIRILRPRGTKLISSAGVNSKIAVEDFPRFSVISFFVFLQPGERKKLEFKFEFPANFAADFAPTKFTIFKQPGAIAQNWEFVFRNFADESTEISGCDFFAPTENISICRAEVSRDREIIFQKLPDRSGPILQFARFLNLNQIELRFSEPIDARKISTEDFEVLDLNRVNDRRDDVFVENLVAEGNSLFLTVSGISKQSREFFRVRAKNLFDLAGNPARENFTATFLQN